MGLIKNAAGLLLVADTGRALFLRRVDDGLWCLPGGYVDEDDVDPLAAAVRELREETGYTTPVTHARLIDVQEGPALVYWTYGAFAPAEYTACLSAEHIAAQWADVDRAPKPLHPGLCVLLARLA